MKLTKIKIEEMANEIIDFLKKHELEDDVCIYYNNKRIHFHTKWDSENEKLIPVEEINENISPLDCFEYVNEKHILSMSFEGAFYDVMNGYNSYTWGLQDKFSEILRKYGLYYELGNAWNLSVFTDIVDYDDIEYTSYEREKEPDPIYIYANNTNNDIPKELIVVKRMWDALSETTEHLGGSCTLGDGFEFNYNGIKYRMVSPSYQGSLIYEYWVETIKAELNEIGATEIYYDYGHLD